jgi:glyoxylase-like metal-dependent hydrolase (beta-lactamase superfamily II)/rhodanese-related sulfurtransferase
MWMKQYYLGCLAHASYLIADEATGTAVVVDPQRDIDQYLHDAAQHRFHIDYVFLTHFHADFLAGHIELRDRVGAAICLGTHAQADFDYRRFAQGDTLTFGQVRLEILETPGHTPEAISILVYDLAQDAQRPHAVLTGDTLFIGDVGRPDLMASVGMSSTDLAGMLYDSLRQKLLPLPDETLVYPAHGAGSMCGKNLSSETFSTLGTQRRFNYALQPMSKREFIELVTADQPEAPSYFSYDAMLNRRERPTLDQTLQQALVPLTLDEIVRQMNAGTQVLDVRDAADFEAGYLHGSVNVGLQGSFATWAGTVLEQDTSIALIATPGQEEEAAMRLGRIGFDHVVGYLAGGAEALNARPDLVRSIERVTADGLAEALAAPTPPLVLDVRGPGERSDKYIEGSVHLPLNRLKRQLDDVPRDRKVVLQCAGGYRSAIAASILAHYGLTEIADLVGGLAAWEEAGLDLVAPVST